MPLSESEWAAMYTKVQREQEEAGVKRACTPLIMFPRPDFINANDARVNADIEAGECSQYDTERMWKYILALEEYIGLSNEYADTPYDYKETKKRKTDV